MQPCPILATADVVHLLVLQLVDDLTAVRLLTSCQALYARYSAYPLTRAVSLTALRQCALLDAGYEKVGRAHCIRQPVWLRIPWLQRPEQRARPSPRYKRGVDRRGFQLPRVLRLKDALWDVRLLQHVPHLTELTMCGQGEWPPGRRYALPRSLRTLQLNSSPQLTVTRDTLPPRLTSLSLGAVANMPLPAGVLPQSLRSLHLMTGFDMSNGVGEGVLPAGLRRLELGEWTLPLSQLRLPSSLVELVVHELGDHPLHEPLAQLELLSIGGAFNRSLTGALPSSLRVLRLTGHYHQPLPASVFARTPHLAELLLGDLVTTTLVGAELPRSLHTLRVRRWEQLHMAQPSDVPPQLRRLVRSTNTWVYHKFDPLAPLAAECGFVIERD